LADARLTLALMQGDIALPALGPVAAIGPRIGADLGALPTDRLKVITGLQPDHDHFAGLGPDTRVAPEGRYGASIIFLPRAKPLAKAWVAMASAITDDLVIVNGAKTDGVESLLRDVRARVPVNTVFSKAHGKCFAFAPATCFEDWSVSPQYIDEGFLTRPGVFSADGVDEGSAMLAAHLPDRPGADLADLGAGWGYLSRAALKLEGVEKLHVVEADHAALGCARHNLPDPRAVFHWADATRWTPPAKLDTVVMNPPFHIGRDVDPDLGRAFITAAASILKPKGDLWMVANRHLPYERTLGAHFAQVREVAGDTRFRILYASRPTRPRR